MKVKFTDNKSYTIEKVNARKLSLRLNNIKPTEKRNSYILEGTEFFEGKIQSLIFPKEHIVSLGDVITIGKEEYKIGIIEYGINYTYYLITEPVNKSAKYLLPLVADEGLNASNYLFMSCLYNTYLYCEEYSQYSDNKHLFLCYRFADNDIYKQLEYLITQQPNYIDVINTKGFVIFVLEIPERYQHLVTEFLNGDYQDFDVGIMATIMNFYDPKNTKNSYYSGMFKIIGDVFDRDSKLLDRMEAQLQCTIPEYISLESKPIKKDETIKL